MYVPMEARYPAHPPGGPIYSRLGLMSCLGGHCYGWLREKEGVWGVGGG